jgi:hypothetical protein
MVMENDLLTKLDVINKKLDSLSTVRVEMMNHNGERRQCDMSVHEFHQKLADNTTLVRLRNGNNKPIFLLRDNLDQAIYNHMAESEKEVEKDEKKQRKYGLITEIIKAVIQSGIIISFIQLLR